MSNDFVEQPLNKRLNKRNIITRLEQVEGKTGAKPSAQIDQIGQISPDTGEMTVTSLKVIDYETGLADVTIDQFGVRFRNQEGDVTFEDTNGSLDNIIIYSDAGNDLVLKNAFGGADVRFDIDDASHNVKQFKLSSDGNIYVDNIAIQSGWNPVTEVWTRTGNHTFTVPTDLTAKYRKGAKASYDDGGAGAEYGVIASSVFGAVTTINLIPNTDYTMAAATITNTRISYIENPEGFPSQFAFTPVIGNLTSTSGTLNGVVTIDSIGHVRGHVDFVFGASSSVGGALSLVLPVTIATYAQTTPIGLARYKDATGGNAASGVILSSGLLIALNSGGAYALGDPVNTTVPFTWATSDVIGVSFDYFA